MHFPCRAKSSVAVLTIWHGHIYHSWINILKKSSFRPQRPASTKQKKKAVVSVVLASTRASYFSLVHEKMIKEKERRTEAQFFLCSKITRIAITTDPMRCSASKKKPTNMPLHDIESSATSLYVSVSPFEHTRTERGYQRAHCSLGLALGKYSSVTKRWLGNRASKRSGSGCFLSKESPRLTMRGVFLQQMCPFSSLMKQSAGFWRNIQGCTETGKSLKRSKQNVFIVRLTCFGSWPSGSS